MKSLFAICVIVCACINTIEQGYAAITCFPNPQRTHTTCVETDTGRSWTTFVAPNGTSTTIPLNTPRDNSAPKHNYSECTLATGCIPNRRE